MSSIAYANQFDSLDEIDACKDRLYQTYTHMTLSSPTAQAALCPLP